MYQIASWDEKPLKEQLKILGDTFYDNEQLVIGLSYYIRAKEIEDTYIIENNMGLIYMKLRDYHLAEEAFNKALKLKVCVEIYHNLIQLYKQQGRLDEAMALIYSIVETYHSGLLLYEAGDISLKKRDYNQALIYFLKSYELDPRPETRNQVIKTRIEARQLKAAMEQVEFIKENDGPNYYLLKAQIFEKAKHLEVAIETIEEGISHLGESKAFYLALARLYRLDNQIIKAIQSVTWLSDAGALDHEIIYEMALIAKQAGRYSEYYEKLDRLITAWKKEARFSLSY